MTSAIFSHSPFEIPHIKIAKLVKLEIKTFLHNMCTIILNHFHLKVNPILLKQFLLLENIWIHVSSILDIEPQLPLRKIHLFKLLFLNKKHPQFEHIEEQLNQSIFKFLFKNFSMLS